MGDHLGAEITYTLGAHNMMYSFIDVKAIKLIVVITRSVEISAINKKIFNLVSL